MNLVSVRITADNLDPMVEFYEKVQRSPNWASRHAPSPSATPVRRGCSTWPAPRNQTAIIAGADTYALRNRSILFRDPDGNLINLFTPVTEDAIKRFRRQ